MKLKYLLLIALMVLTVNCGGNRPPIPSPIPPTEPPALGIDPTITWDAVTTTCAGTPITATYNVFVINGAGPIPTVEDPNEITVCASKAKADLSQVSPENPTPLILPTLDVIKPPGIYTVAVESLNGTSRSALSIQETREVTDNPNAPANLHLTWMTPEGKKTTLKVTIKKAETISLEPNPIDYPPGWYILFRTMPVPLIYPPSPLPGFGSRSEAYEYSKHFTKEGIRSFMIVSGRELTIMGIDRNGPMAPNVIIR